MVPTQPAINHLQPANDQLRKIETIAEVVQNTGTGCTAMHTNMYSIYSNAHQSRVCSPKATMGTSVLSIPSELTCDHTPELPQIE